MERDERKMELALQNPRHERLIPSIEAAPLLWHGAAPGIAMAPLRRFGVAAAALIDDGNANWENDRASPVMEPEADYHTTGRGIQWDFNGSSGVEKRVDPSLVSKLLNVPNIPMGNLKRAELKVEPSLSKQGSTISALMSEGTNLQQASF